MVARDRNGRRGEHRAGIGDQKVNLVLGDELVIERRGGRRVALVVIGDELDRKLLVEGFHIDAALGVLLLRPELERAIDRHGDRGVTARGSIERADLEFGGRIRREGRTDERHGRSKRSQTVLEHRVSSLM